MSLSRTCRLSLHLNLSNCLKVQGMNKDDRNENFNSVVQQLQRLCSRVSLFHTACMIAATSGEQRKKLPNHPVCH